VACRSDIGDGEAIFAGDGFIWANLCSTGFKWTGKVMILKARRATGGNEAGI